ncbi:MAG: phage terminase large subunit family protein, partial [Limisphaerales bacterium]
IGARLRKQTVVDTNNSSSYMLQLSSGCRIHCLSSNPDAQAGKTGDRVLDEFALHPDPKRLYSIAYPGITWGGSLEIFSTHRGTDNYFNVLINEILHGGNPKGFSFHRVTLQDALDQGFLHKLQSKLPPEDPRQQMDEADYFNFIRAGCPDEETFQQEYMCVPGDDALAFLSYDLIGSCEGPEPAPITDSSELYVGVDIGRERDLTVIWVLEKLGDVFYTQFVHVMNCETFDAQEGALYALLEDRQVKRCCIDQTGIGRQFAERAQRRFGKYKVEGVNFTSAVKEELAYPVRAAFEAKRLRIPSDPKIRADLRAIKKEITASGNIRFTADRGVNGHSDRFWALALALHAGGRPPSSGPSAHLA